MANGKPIIVTEFEIGAAGFSSGAGVTYTLPNQEEIAFNIEEGTVTVEDGQTIINFFNEDFDVLTYDLDVLSDTNVQTGGGTIVDAAKIIFKGATNAETLSYDNIRLRARPDFSTDRKGARVLGSIRATDPVITSA